MGVCVCERVDELRWLQRPDMNSCWKMKIQVQPLNVDVVTVVDVCLRVVFLDGADVVVVVVNAAASIQGRTLCILLLRRSFNRHVRRKGGYFKNRIRAHCSLGLVKARPGEEGRVATDIWFVRFCLCVCVCAH